jgi:dnd system-associated protein 4
MKSRISPPGDHDLKALLEDLTTASRRYAFPLFETKQKALMFSAALGRHLKRKRAPSSRDSGAAIRFDIFQKGSDDEFVFALGVDDADDLRVLHPDREEEIVVSFEEYAAAGLREILSLASRTGADTLDVVLELVQGVRSNQDSPPDGIDPDVFKNLIG